MPRRLAPMLATLVAVGGAALFVFVQMRPGLLFLNTTAAGGDMGAHVWGPAFMRDHLLPHGRITGWAPDWYAGFPFPSFYFPLPTLLIVVLDVLLPYGVAFKLVTVLGLVGLPVAAWAFGRLAGLAEPGPACLAVATVPFLFDRSFTIYGGNIPSTLAGEFSFSISLAVALVFLGVLAKALDTGRHRALAAILLAVTLLCHVIPTFFAVAGAVVLTLLRPSARRIGRTVVAGVVAGLLAAFWALPFVLRLPYTNDMGWERITLYRNNLLPHDARWLVVAAGVGVLAAIFGRCRVGGLLTVLAVVAGLGFRFAPQGKIWNARLLPFWFLCLYLLAGVGAAAVLRSLRVLARPGPAREGLQSWVATLGPPLVLAGTLVFVALPLQILPTWSPLTTGDRSFIPSWTAWNYSGYERKTTYPEYKSIIDTMAEVGRSEGCGRAVWEYEQELNELGTPLALMLLPYWTRGCIGSMEGLYYESSATTPYHFMLASEVSKRPSRPQRGLPYRDLDLNPAVPHLQLLGVRYYMAFSPEARAMAAQQPDLELVASTDSYTVNYPQGPGQRQWEVYKVAGSDLVTPLDREPVVVTGLQGGEKAWLAGSVAWWQDTPRFAVPLADDGPGNWRRVADVATPVAGRPVEPARVSKIRSGDDRISFDVDRPGSPVLVKTSYFPNWKASGADGPWRVTPNLMVVVPTSRHVELHYGYTGVDLAGYGLTALGVGICLVLWRRRPAPEPATEAGAPAEVDADEPIDGGELTLTPAGGQPAPWDPDWSPTRHQPAPDAPP